MKQKLKQIFSKVQVWILIFFVVLAIIAINPKPLASGVAIRGVEKDSPAYLAGIRIPDKIVPPTSREVIKEINQVKIENIQDYLNVISTLKPNMTALIVTNKGQYSVLVGDNNGSVYLGLRVYDAPKSNIQFGLDIVGGTRAILKPEKEVNDTDLDLVIENIKQRLNFYGLSDLSVRIARDLDGKEYIIVEIAGESEEIIRDLLTKQGNFVAKIGNKTVFVGGKKDITYVCRSPECSHAVDPTRGGCQRQGNQYVCAFSFSISLSPDAAKRQAEITKDLDVVYSAGSTEGYLNETLDLYLDGKLYDSLRISAGLKGRETTQILITGYGKGATYQEAVADSTKQMKSLQSILMSGSMPVKLDVVSVENISPKLGKEFISGAAIIGLFSMIAIVFILFVRYREPAVIMPMFLIMLSEVIILLGFAALTSWNLDSASIAGILVAVGTGVDDLIVIMDEIKKGYSSKFTNWKKILGRAFFIIFGSYFTTVAAMVPLVFAGAGLLKGFAIATITGVTIGVVITRPAFSKIAEILIKKEE
ncbi:MAG: preprotein translocase subunit SecD [Candidatus Woesearchaeota archaeon]|nr:preprotein translocase subunit SecD [Candidatus Woesearchaeota archaeon]MDN5327421.1 preprotein translocase subunit SecD [Candidatus Woesearchaeota archaeon]